MIPAVLGLAIALDSLRLMTTGLAPNEGGTVTHHFEAWGSGFYLWIASLAVLALGAGVLAAVEIAERRSARR